MDQQTKLQLDYNNATKISTNYSRVAFSPEECHIDIGTQSMRPNMPVGPDVLNTTVVDIAATLIMTPYAAKRLQSLLDQALSKYQDTYGHLEMDINKRVNEQSGEKT